MLDHQAHPPLGLLPLLADRQFRVPGLVDPLLEEPAEILSGGFFDGFFEILRRDGSSLVGSGVLPDGAEKPLVSQQGSQHVQDEKAFLVGGAVKQIFRFGKKRGDQRAAVALLIFFEIAGPLLKKLEQILLPAVAMLPVGSRPKRGKPLVEPEIGPVGAGQEIAEPLVGQLVRHQVHAGRLRFRSLFVESAVGQGGRADVFHPPKDEVLDRHLRILGIGIRKSNAVGEETQPRRSLGERAQRLVASRAGRDVVFERHIARPLAILLKLAGDDRG